jgi:hypothetical protein
VSGAQWLEEAIEFWTDMMTVARERGIEAARVFWLDSPLYTTLKLEKNRSARERVTRIVGEFSGWHWLHQDPRRSPDPPAYERLEQISAPTLIRPKTYRDLASQSESHAWANNSHW